MAMAHLVPSFTELEDGDFPVRYVTLPEAITCGLFSIKCCFYPTKEWILED
jgi:hypothetical protein